MLAEGRDFSQKLLHLLDYGSSAIVETVSLICCLKVACEVNDFLVGQVFDECLACKNKALSLAFADHLVNDAVPLAANGLCPLLNSDAARLNEATEASGLKAILAEDLIDLSNGEGVERSLLDKTSLAEAVDDSLVRLSLLADHKEVNVYGVVAVAYQCRKDSLASLQVGCEGGFADIVLLDKFLTEHLNELMLAIHDGQRGIDILV